MTKELPYHPFYCEENIWRLALGDWVRATCGALFVTNEQRAVAMMAQRGAEQGARGLDSTGQLLVWDYHVVLLELGSQPAIWDPNSALGAPVLASAYLSMSFPQGVPAQYRPKFRWIPKARLLRDFRSDRRHMRTIDGGWLKEPPPWEPPGPGHTLERILDLGDPFAGAVWSTEQLMAAIAARRLPLR